MQKQSELGKPTSYRWFMLFIICLMYLITYMDRVNISTTAPMIRECPLNMECRVTQILDFPKHDIVIGEIVQTYCDEEVLTDGELDYTKIRPILFTMAGHGFWKLGERFATAWEVGKEFKG